eukprot:scaffold12401_cov156-Ochromonas_danica.AAC.1
MAVIVYQMHWVLSAEGVNVCCADVIHRVESLNEENRYDCSHCARRTLAEKYLRLEEIPSLLCIQLKRFVYNGDHGRKLMEVVDYSPYLDVKPFLKATIFN